MRDYYLKTSESLLEITETFYRLWANAFAFEYSIAIRWSRHYIFNLQFRMGRSERGKGILYLILYPENPHVPAVPDRPAMPR